MSDIARRIAICQHPNGEGVWWDVHDEVEPTCIQDCDCKPVVYVLEAQQPQGAIEALRAAQAYLERGSRISEDADVRAKVDAALANLGGQ